MQPAIPRPLDILAQFPGVAHNTLLCSLQFPGVALDQGSSQPKHCFFAGRPQPVLYVYVFTPQAQSPRPHC